MKAAVRTSPTMRARFSCLFKRLLALMLLAAIAGKSAQAESLLNQPVAEALYGPPSATISPSGKYATLQEGTGEVWLIDTVSGAKTPLRMPSREGLSIVWASNGSFLVAADKQSVSVYQVPSGRLSAHWNGAGVNVLPAISPNGKYLSFIRGHNLWISSVDGKDQHPLTSNGNTNTLNGEADPLYAHEFNLKTHYWWAPDSASIAWIETKFHGDDHYPAAGAELPAFQLKALDLKSGTTKTIAASSDAWPYLLRVAWHPDGCHILVYRMNRLQTAAELVLFDTGSAPAHEQTVLTEKDDYWVNAPATPVFVQGGKRIAVTSERSGHNRVYLYDTNGGMVRDLTPADLEVYRLYATVSPDNIFVDASSGDMQQQNLYKIELSTGAARRVTEEDGWHEPELDSSGDAYVDTYSSARVPPSVRWHGAANGSLELAASPSNMKPVANRTLSIQTHDGISLLARLFTPEEFDAKKPYPLIVYTFSGPQGRVAQDSWGGWQMAWNREMVRKGYLVLAVDTRGSMGYGHLFEEYLHHRLGAQETTDLREVITYLKQQDYVDSRRLGIWGCDYGAQIAMHAMMEIPNGFKAGFADSPILDWDDYDAYFTERYLAMPKSHIADYDDSSPLDSARRMTGELLIAFNPGNPIVRSSQQAALDEALALAKNRLIAKKIHRLTMDDPDYRTHPHPLAALLSAMTKFFQQSL